MAKNSCPVQSLSIQALIKARWARGFVALLSLLTLGACIGGGGAPGVSSDAANLASLEVLDGNQVVAISPAFESGRTSYSVNVGGAVESVSVKVVPVDPKATIRINNTAATSDQVFGPIPVAAGSNTINVVVDVPGTVRAYILTVVRGTNAHLAAMSISPGALAETFDPNFLNYTAVVGNATGQVTLTATLADQTSTLKIKGQAATSGQPSSPVNLALGPNVINVVVTALDGTTKSYGVTVTRSASPIADLSAITLTNNSNSQTIPLTSSFLPNTTSYATQQVLFSVTQVKLTVAVADPTSAVAVQAPGQAGFLPATPGVTFGPMVLPNANPTPNTITIRVTAQSGISKLYTVVVPRMPASANSSLQNITVSVGVLTPAVSPTMFTYHVSIPGPVSNVVVKGISQDPIATVRVNNQPIPAQGSSTVTVPSVNAGTTVPIVVTAEDGTSQTTYTIVFNTDANLTSLSISSGTILFSPTTLNYAVTVPNGTASVTLTANQEKAGSLMTVASIPGPFNSPLVSSVPSAAIPLSVGANTLTLRVTTLVGSHQDYNITVTRQSSSNANLSALTVSAGTLSPAFLASTTGYTLNVANSATSLTVAATAEDPTATVAIEDIPLPVVYTAGSATKVIDLSTVFNKTISVHVKAQDTVTMKTYQIALTRNTTDLASLTISAGTLTPVFSVDRLAYTTGVLAPAPATLTITAVPAGTATVVSIAGVSPVGNQATVTLPAVPNPIQIVVNPAGGGAPTTYSLTVQ
ncbi:MAG: cadherin-like beta sandwich domain-containing protein [Nitrospiraceae bacterium]